MLARRDSAVPGELILQRPFWPLFFYLVCTVNERVTMFAHISGSIGTGFSLDRIAKDPISDGLCNEHPDLVGDAWHDPKGEWVRLISEGIEEWYDPNGVEIVMDMREHGPPEFYGPVVSDQHEKAGLWRYFEGRDIQRLFLSPAVLDDVKPIPVSVDLGDTQKLVLHFYKYGDGSGTAIQAVTDDGEPYGALTKNAGRRDSDGYFLRADEVAVKTYSDNESWVPKVLEALPDVFIPTGKIVKSGYVTLPVYRIVPPPLAALAGRTSFTVLLLQPPELCESGEVETFLMCVIDMKDVTEAIATARQEAVIFSGKSHPEDWKVLAVFAGSHVDIKDYPQGHHAH